MDLESLRVGQGCDAFHEGCWYRATIRQTSKKAGENILYTVTFPGYTDETYTLVREFVREKRGILGWMEFITDYDGSVYFLNETTGDTQWHVPEVAPTTGGLVGNLRQTVSKTRPSPSKPSTATIALPATIATTKKMIIKTKPALPKVEQRKSLPAKHSSVPKLVHPVPSSPQSTPSSSLPTLSSSFSKNYHRGPPLQARETKPALTAKALALQRKFARAAAVQARPARQASGMTDDQVIAMMMSSRFSFAGGDCGAGCAC